MQKFLDSLRRKFTFLDRKSYTKRTIKCYTSVIEDNRKDGTIMDAVKSKASCSVGTIAKWFLSKDSMTHKKLQKLCYYAQAWYCALYDGTPLFEDEIQAWVHGPVVASLYPKYADFKWMDIPQTDFDENQLSEKVLDVLNAVYNTYGGFSGDQLESLTHSEQPWKDARGELQPWETSTAQIPCSAMRDYYGEKYEKAQND